MTETFVLGPSRRLMRIRPSGCLIRAELTAVIAWLFRCANPR